MSSQKVGPTIADDIKDSALWSVVFSLIVIFLYILIRFRKWQFSLGAVIAVFHDVLNTADYTTIPQNRERTFLIWFKGEANWEFISDENTVSNLFYNDFRPSIEEKTDSFRKYLETDIDEKYFYTNESYNYKEL